MDTENKTQEIQEESPLNTNPDMQKGFEEYAELNKRAEEKASQMAEDMIKDIIVNGKKGEDNMTVALMTTAKLLTHLASYFYDTPDEFVKAVDKARHSVTEDIIPALLDPQPCGNCPNCQNGKKDECTTPVVRTEYTQSRFLPVLCNMLIEYDIFNKVLWMNTAGKARAEEEASKAVDKEMEENNADTTTTAE